MRGAALVAIAAAAMASACHGRSTTKSHGSAAPAAPAAPSVVPAAYRPALLVPHTTGPIHCDGEAEEPDWRRALRSGAFADTRNGRVARPYSEARFLWDEDNLYVLMYAADDDIRSGPRKHDAPLWMGDAFSLKLRPAAVKQTFDIDFAADSTVSDARESGTGALDAAWESHAEVGVDRDGTLDDARDEDEEWLVETRIPLSSFGVRGAAGVTLAVRVERCDTPRHGPRGCGAFAAPGGAGLVPLELQHL